MLLRRAFSQPLRLFHSSLGVLWQARAPVPLAPLLLYLLLLLLLVPALIIIAISAPLLRLVSLEIQLVQVGHFTF